VEAQCYVAEGTPKGFAGRPFTPHFARLRLFGGVFVDISCRFWGPFCGVFVAFLGVFWGSKSGPLGLFETPDFDEKKAKSHFPSRAL
jgi:hypothetical protein